jgi:hypothetical protein
MAQQKIKDYSTKYKFQWWYNQGGKQLVVNIASTLGFFLLIYEMLFLAYLLEP